MKKYIKFNYGEYATFKTVEFDGFRIQENESK